MKHLVFVAAAASLCFGQVARVAPPSASKVLKMLTGDWRVGAAEVEYGTFPVTQEQRDPLLVGRIQTSSDGTDRHWRRFLLVHAAATEVTADFTDAKGKVTHYILREATDQTLRFEETPDEGNPVHRLVYERVPRSGALDYRFEVGDRVTDRGRMQPAALVRPLSE